MGKAKQLESRSRRDSRHVNPNSKCNKRRIRWTQKLHQRFEDAVAALGGAGVATPKEILELMKAPEVTIMHVRATCRSIDLPAQGAAQDRTSIAALKSKYPSKTNRLAGFWASRPSLMRTQAKTGMVQIMMLWDQSWKTWTSAYRCLRRKTMHHSHPALTRLPGRTSLTHLSSSTQCRQSCSIR